VWDLSNCSEPSALEGRTCGRLSSSTYVPDMDPTIESTTRDEVWLYEMPVDVGHSAIVCTLESGDDGSSRVGSEVPQQPGCGGRALDVGREVAKSVATCIFSLEVETTYSAWLRCGFHWTSATSQAPP